MLTGAIAADCRMILKGHEAGGKKGQKVEVRVLTSPEDVAGNRAGASVRHRRARFRSYARHFRFLRTTLQ
jgi:hypothetical protein